MSPSGVGASKLGATLPISKCSIFLWTSCPFGESFNLGVRFSKAYICDLKSIFGLLVSKPSKLRLK